jgi:hypothetical protein
MFDIGSYEVSIKTPAEDQATAVLAIATAVDMPMDWSCPWQDIWNASKREGFCIAKLASNQQLWGLIQYAVFPKKEDPVFLFIDHLETNPIDRGRAENRLAYPVGKWLIWYCVKVALEYCSGEDDKLVYLLSKPTALDYYHNKIQMEWVETIDLNPGEKVDAFKFTRESARTYLRQQEKRFGSPRRINPRAS